jgi:ankyrin repeat protein
MMRLLLGAKADVHAVGAMAAAGLGGDLACIRLLLDAQVDVDSYDEYGDTALTYAIDSGHVGTVRALVEARASVNGIGGVTPLRHAADLAMASLLLAAKADVNAADDMGMAPILYAAYENHQDMVSLLLEAKAHVETADGHGETALAHSVAGSGWPTAASRLLEAKANVDAADHLGQTPLWHAAGNVEATTLLLEAKAAVNAVDHAGHTVLFHALRTGGNESVADLLLAAKADAAMLPQSIAQRFCSRLTASWRKFL